MAWGSGARFRARLRELQENLARRNEDEKSEEAARRLDAEEVGRRADRRKEERKVENAPPDTAAPPD